MRNAIEPFALDAFAKLDSDICVALKNENKDYRCLLDEMAAIMDAHPALLKLLDHDAAVALTREDAAAFQSYRKLQREADDMERHVLYLRGYQDGLVCQQAEKLPK